MHRLASLGLASVLAVASGGLLITGCGDNLPRQNFDAGTGDADGSSADRPDSSSADRAEVAEGGSDVATACPVVSFVSPTDGQMLTAADDKSGTECASGFKLDVTVSVAGAVDGTPVELHAAVGGTPTDSPPLLATATVLGGQVVFQNVGLSEGATTLSVETGGVPCKPTVAVTVDCQLPTCAITAPSHDTLNGVAAPTGDRASSAGSSYQVAFTVMTNVEDGQPVALTVTNADVAGAQPVPVPNVNAMSGVATFAGVTLVPDGHYDVSAACTSRANVVGHSAQFVFTVDTTPPDLTVDSPASGALIGPGSLTPAGAFQVCATTTSDDAANLPMSATVSQSNLCVSRGQTSSCVPVLAVNTSTCASVACPGGAPFDLTVTLTDGAGNPQTQTVTGISCASSSPAVQIVAPLTDAPSFLDQSKRLLAATAAQAFKDADGTSAGAQTTVVACTDTMGASARLFVGRQGDASLTALGAAATVVPAVVADSCPNGYGYVAKFTGVTLPESAEAADGTLSAATEIRVDVTDPVDAAAVGTSGPTDLWVDSLIPTLTELSPSPLCGAMVQVDGTYTTNVALNSSTATVTLTVTNGGTTMFGPVFMPGTPTGVATFSSVAFPQGVNTVASTATEPSGNTVSLAPPVPMPACTVTVGATPVVTFTAPAPGQNLCANGNTLATCIADSTPGTPGWQGNVAVHVTVGGASLTTGNVTFTIAGGAPQVAVLDAMGNATLTGLTIADAAAVVLTATTDNVPTHGVGMASNTVIVDTQPPGGGAALAATPLSRRQTSFTLGWTAPSDNGLPVSSYDIHIKVRDASTNNPCGQEVGQVPYTGTPNAPGMPETITVSNLLIETAYCFTVAGLDAVGNAGSVVTTIATATFNVTVLTGTGSEIFGSIVDGTGDFGAPGASGGGSFANDGLSDLLVGSQAGSATGQNAYIFFGRVTGYPAIPDVTITGPPAVRFGAGIVAAGDIDGDGLTDVAIASYRETPPKVYVFSRKNAPWAVGGAWPPALTAAQANYVITASADFAGSTFGFTMTRLGDFDGQAPDDLAIGAYLYGGGAAGLNAGRVVVVRGSNSFSSVTLPDATNAIVLDGAAAGDIFGRYLEGLVDHTLVVAAPGGVGAAAVGKVYAFRGPVVGSTLALNAAVDSTVLSGVQYGFAVATLGPLGQSPVAVSLTGIGSNFVDVDLASAAEGPFLGASGATATHSVRFISSSTGNSLGAVNIGSVVSGTALAASVIGSDSVPDLVIAGQADPGNPVYIVSGAKLPSMSGTIDLVVATASPVTSGVIAARGRLPSDWAGAYNRSGLVLDLNGDGFADFALSEQSLTVGRVAVFW